MDIYRTVETTVSTDSPTTAAAIKEASMDFTKIKEELRHSYNIRESQIKNQMALERQKIEIEGRAMADQLEVERLKNKEVLANNQRLQEELKLIAQSNNVGAEVKKQTYEGDLQRLRMQNEELINRVQNVERQNTLIEVENDEKQKCQTEAITTASATMDGQTKHIFELDSQITLLTNELGMYKSQTAALRKANSRQADDSEKIGILEARVESLTSKLQSANLEIKHVTDAKTYEIEDLQKALSDEAKRASAAVQEQLSIMTINEHASTSEVKELQNVISSLVLQQKQREALCDKLRCELEEKDNFISELKSRLNISQSQSTDANASLNRSLFAQQELWHSERSRLEKESAGASHSYNKLKSSLEHMISKLEKRLSLEATERNNEKLRWEDSIRTLTLKLEQAQKELSEQRNTKQTSPPLQYQTISDTSTIPQVPEAKSASEDILTRIESHLCDVFRKKDEDNVEEVLRQELQEKKSEIERLNKKYRSAKKKLSKSMQETENLSRELSTHQSAILIQREVDSRRKQIISSKNSSPVRRVPSPKVAFRNNTAHRLTWQRGSLLGHR